MVVFIEKWLKTKICRFFMENLKIDKKGQKTILHAGAGIGTPDFQ